MFPAHERSTSDRAVRHGETQSFKCLERARVKSEKSEAAITHQLITMPQMSILRREVAN